MKIYFYGLHLWEGDYLKDKIGKSLSEHEIEFSEKDLNPDSLPENDAEIISVFVDSVVDKKVLDAMPNLKMIATRSTGFDHIDLKEAQKKGVVVSNVPAYGANTVAEHAFALLLTLSHKVYEAYDQVREKGSFSQEGLQGFDLLGKTIGVVGTGHIGTYAIKIAKGFGMEVIAHDINPNSDLEKELDFKYKDLDELLSSSDIVTIHVPFCEDTEGMFNEERLRKMKEGAVLINTSRGGIVETEALVKVLEEGHLAGAGLDVLEEEGVVSDELEFLRKEHPQESDLRAVLANHVLIDMPNVIVTPHNAFNTKEALERILKTTVLNIESFIEGNPENTVGV